MPLDPKLELGAQLAIGLAGLFVPGTAVSALGAVFAAVKSFNDSNGKPADYVPTRDEWNAFIASREAKRIGAPVE